MTRLKKSLAMFLALVMAFTTMSVAATVMEEWNPDDEPNDLTFTVKFFREDDENSGEWIETEKVAPGERVKIRVYIKTGYPSYGGDMCFLFDNQYFSAEGIYSGTITDLTTNSNYAGPDDDATAAGGYQLSAKAIWYGDDSNFASNPINYIINKIEGDPNYFDTRDLISNNIVYGGKIPNAPLVDNDWLFEYELNVNDNTVTNTVDTEGEGRVPPYYKTTDPERSYLFIDIAKGMAGKTVNDYMYNINMYDWDCEFKSTPDSVTTTSEVVFDMGLVDENGVWSEDTYTIEKGIITKEVDFSKITNPAYPDGSKVFSHWSAQKPGEGVEQSKATTFKYDYDVQTLYAVWTDAPDVSYTLKEFYMNADGSYPTDVEGITVEAAPNSTVSAPASTDPHFTLDETKSSSDVVVKADGSTVVNAYYIRNEYELVYHYKDLTGDKTEVVSVRYGAELPGFAANPSGKPELSGYTFLGWTTVENGTTAEDLPTAMPDTELHLYAVYQKGESKDIDFIFDAGEGTFSDGTKIKRYSYSNLEKVITPEDPEVPGKRFVEWTPDVPEFADQDREFEAIYEDILYTVTFKADTNNDGDYDDEEDIVEEYEFAYGEKIYTEYAPINYPADAWEFEDGTAFEFSDDENKAYTVTEDLVLYTEADDKYPAKFYLTQEDIDNGEEPYAEFDVEFDTEIPVPAAPTAEDIPGYNFLAWEPDVQSGIVMDSTEGKIFVAVLEPKDITVTFDPNGGECDVESETVTYGEEIGKLPGVEKEGFELLGWYTPDNELAGMPGEPYEVPASNITLTAKWKGETHKITFVDTDDSVIGEIAAETDADVFVPENLVEPKKDGYKFAGWDKEIPKKMPAKDMTIKASWNELYDVTYKNEDGSVFEAFINAGVAGDDMPVPENKPSKEGFYFNGWVDANGNEVTEIPEGNVDLYPDFKENPKYTITYMSKGEVVNTVSYEEGKAIAEYTLADIEGETFKGWNPALPSTMPAEDLTVEAVWETNKNGIKLDAGEGKFDNGESVFDEDFEFGTDLTDKLPENPEREGYEFKGWQDAEGNIVTLPNTMPDSAFDLTAKWEVKQYTITFDTDGGNDIEAKTYDFGAAIGELPVPEKAGKDFAGWMWTNEDGEAVEEPSTMPAENLTATAKWENKKYSVNYYYAKDGALYTSEKYEQGASITHPADPTLEGFTFNGWVDADGNAVPDDMVMGEADINLYAKFDINSYKVTYIVDGEVYAEYDVVYQAEVPTPEDPADSAIRLFAGWSPAVADKMPAYDLTYTATWEDPEPDKYTATFLRADGGVHAKRVLAEGDEIIVPEAPKKFGYVFVGWEPEVPETMPAENLVFEPQFEVDKTFVTIVVGGTVVAGGAIAASIANAAIITGVSIVGGVLVIVGVAELVKHTHTVTFIVDGDVYKTYKVVEGTKIPVPADPAKDGFIFEGWNPEVPEKMGKEDLVFEATWTEKSDDDSADVDVEIPETGSVAGGLAALAAISGAAAAAYVITRRKKED